MYICIAFMCRYMFECNLHMTKNIVKRKTNVINFYFWMIYVYIFFVFIGGVHSDTYGTLLTMPHAIISIHHGDQWHDRKANEAFIKKIF